MDVQAAARELRILFDAHAYLERYPDVGEAGMDAVEHYLLFGADEGRQPCDMFDGAWYNARYPDVALSGLNPLLHYIRHGAMEMRDPNPGFSGVFYVDAHPESIGNPLLYHLLIGQERGWPTEPPVTLEGLLPSPMPALTPPQNVTVDVVIPVYRGYHPTKRCIESVLADAHRPSGRILVVDDASPERQLSIWLDRLAKNGQIILLRNARNLGFVRSVNRGMRAAGRNDVVLLNSDTEVCPGWLGRLASATYSQENIATASPFSNNATICSYPNVSGGTLPSGFTLSEVDQACHEANHGRVIDVPTTVGFCMYIRRAALDHIGAFDARAFGHGYGEEVDFCHRATRQGWRHVLACDVFVYHEGNVSFGPESVHARKGREALRKRYPDHDTLVDRHLRFDPAQPARFALTAALFRNSGRAGILLVSHGQGGGVRRQIQELISTLNGKVNILLLQPDMRGVGISAPTIEMHPVLTLAADRIDDLAQYLESAGMQRIHIHHMMDIRMDIKALIIRLGVSFDFTVHDYFTICPQVNLLPKLDGQYCNEPDPRHCNACISATPNNGAVDIHSWRRQFAWIFSDADRVICPSHDAQARLGRYGLGNKAIVVPHEAINAGYWPNAPIRLQQAALPQKPLSIALLGVLADRKGLATVSAVAEAANTELSFHLIGYAEQELEPGLAARLKISGVYDDENLSALIDASKHHILWFPAQWPETYSYTLSAAIDSGRAIVAADIGAFSERLIGRPLTWLVSPNAPAQVWLDAFAAAARALRNKSPQKKGNKRAAVPNYYSHRYLQPLVRPAKPSTPRPMKRSSPRILLLPEQTDNGMPSPCAYIRLLQPWHHRSLSTTADIRATDELSVYSEAADTIITHRHALRDIDEAEALIAHCRAHRIKLVYDLDDDLQNIPDDHADFRQLRGQAPIVRRMTEAADSIWVSTPTLATRLGRSRRKAQLVPNALDEQLWWPPASLDRPVCGPLRLLYMGTGTHAADLTMILPALARLRATFGARVEIDIIGVTRSELPAGLNRIAVPYLATQSYPAFVNWLSLQNNWHIGLAPLADTAFNRAKSPIKAMDYAALGLPTVASGIGVYQGVVCDGVNGLLVPNTEIGWFGGLARLVRDPVQRQLMAKRAYADCQARFTLSSQAVMRRKILSRR